MRILIDLQGAQTDSRFRGIGRYSVEHAKAVIRSRRQHDVFILLNGMLHESLEALRDIFLPLLPIENLLVWFGPNPVAESNPGNAWRYQAAEAIRDAAIAASAPDIVHISSPFEGFADNAVTSVTHLAHERQWLLSASLYDLIPFVYPQDYLDHNDAYRAFYMERVAALKSFDTLLAISESSKAEAIRYLTIAPRQIVNVSSAAGDEFHPVPHEECAGTLDKFELRPGYVLYTGGSDKRKNLPRLLAAYAALPEETRSVSQLVIAGKVSTADMPQLRKLASQLGLEKLLVFTGFLTEHELLHLYSSCAVFVFPSWHEGFGLPVLEALRCGAPVLAANASSLPEVLGCEAALFDPFSVEDLTEKLQRVLIDDDFRTDIQAAGSRHIQQFSWDQTGERTIGAWEQAYRDARAEPDVAARPAPTSGGDLYGWAIDRIAAIDVPAGPSPLDLLLTAQCLFTSGIVPTEES